MRGTVRAGDAVGLLSVKPFGAHAELEPEPDETMRVWSGTREGSETVGEYIMPHPNSRQASLDWPGMKLRECVYKGPKTAWILRDP